MPFVIHFRQQNGGDGRECHLSLVSIRKVVVVGMNVICRSLQAGEWWWWV